MQLLLLLVGVPDPVVLAHKVWLVAAGGGYTRCCAVCHISARAVSLG
jgi:hypothetical protein